MAGFVSNGIANALDGSEDALLSLDVQEFWQDLDMPRLRAKIMEEVAVAVRSGQITSFLDYQTLLESYDTHAPLVEGQEAFGVRIQDDDDDFHDATGDDGDLEDHGMGGGDDDDDDPPPPGPPPLPPPAEDPDVPLGEGGGLLSGPPKVSSDEATAAPTAVPPTASSQVSEAVAGPHEPERFRTAMQQPAVIHGDILTEHCGEPHQRLKEGWALAVRSEESDHGGKTGVGVAVRAADTDGAAKVRAALDAGATVKECSASVVPEHPMARAARDKELLALQRQRCALEAALQGARRAGGDRYLEETLQARLRAVNKKTAQMGDPTRLHLRAIAMQRDEKVKTARAESKAQEARSQELKLLVELRKAEADIAKTKTKELAAASKAAVLAAKQEKEAEARCRALKEEQARRFRLEFAASLFGELNEYIRDEKNGHERFQRCQRLALHAARVRAGLQKLDVPRFWAPSITGLKQLMPEGHTVRLRAKSEVLYASPDFCWVLFGKGSHGKEGKWTAENEPRYAFRRLVERLMPGYFDALSGRYGVDNLLAECHQILDLAFVAATWRYTMIVNKKYYRCGLAEWPPTASKWNGDCPGGAATTAASSQASAVSTPAPVAEAAATTAVASQVSAAGAAAVHAPGEAEALAQGQPL